MAATQDPIPPEALPPRWGLADCRDERFTYRHSRPPIELIAEATTADRSHPGLGLCRCWELRYRYFLADRAVSESIGRVSTQRAAIDGLLECMHRIHDTVSTADDPFAVREVLHSVSLSALVPSGMPASSK
ncbi:MULTISPECIES: hypothetical protein [Natrinema]|uniref:Uncharacterized protein n=1 Tax=Natrinema gari JCM 14663 TaxID=1230459 RepID=L9YY16_9EURY|nr:MULTISPECIES: hypothetical protein [Natrinema]AFO55638.1 hypothetical protein NJ7G_0385 [Natrinema sp. J7-2]ELY79145.1 hypothetical protein C486_12151 [Natrinema gari JCM 14663]